MRHGKAHRKFGRERNQRKALLRSLSRSLIVHGKIVTTEAKAKEIRPYVEKLVTAAKQDTHAARRLVSTRLSNEAKLSKKLFTDLAPKYKERTGGYTRIVKLPRRKSDGSTMAIIEFV
ncbi:MAG: 50S ribosomal protein L17 [bacterium]|nr:50S ribosomal protein L17 [bacterium]